MSVKGTKKPKLNPLDLASIEDRDMCWRLQMIKPGQQIIYAIGGPGNWLAFRVAYQLYLEGKLTLFQRVDKSPKPGELRTFYYVAVGLEPPYIPVVEVERF